MKQRKSQEIVIDWFRIVFPYNFEVQPDKYHISRSGNKIQSVKPLTMNEKNEVDYILNLFNLPLIKDKFEDIKVENQWQEIKPLWNYDFGYKLGNIRIFFNKGRYDERMPKTRADMGVAFEMSGRAIRQFENYMYTKGWSWKSFLKYLYEQRPDAKVTRMDIALDIINGSRSLAPRNLLRLTNKGQLSTKIKTYQFFESGSTLTGDIQGETFYLGRDGFRLRVYDKKGERIYSHGDYISDDEIERWVRWEIELTNDYSKSFVNEILNDEDISVLYFRLLNKTMKFVQPNKDNNEKQRSKRKLLGWWKNFVTQKEDDVKKFEILRPEKIKDVEHINRYLEHQVSKTLTKRLIACHESGGNPQQLLTHLIEHGIQKLSYDDVIEIKHLIDNSYELERKGKSHLFVPDQLKLNLSDEDYQEINKKVKRLEKHFDTMFL